MPNAKATLPIGKTTTINISEIRTDGGTQSRWQCNHDTVLEYAEAIAAGATFPAVTVFHDGKHYWLADGFHRVEAHQQAGKRKVGALVLSGTCRDAILYSVGANHTHGLRRSNSDKGCAVLRLLNDEEWSKWSDREIARQCNVGHPFVAKIRAEHAPHHLEEIPDSRTVKRCETTYQMNTRAIGKKPAAPAEVPSPASIAQPPVDDAGSGLTEADAIRAEIVAEKPQAIRDMEAAKAEAIDRRKTAPADIDRLTDRITELEEQVSALETENAELKAEIAKYGEMRVQFEQGGFEKVLADKDEEIRVLKTRVARESEDKDSWRRSANAWKKKAESLGTVSIDINTGEIVDG
ncbi:ParB N-terminal domain-containing protein [Kumtagia ephedrae]|uniref:ParB-like N-terminal domain-containing protein n=1 Tax=Kumtagia ephedrae TaxID=2116701 RepID=A0A2P7SQ00_9HYPH|nr:ParB N-terminal domain-containing protein [Mesorhizobium ephedrae]PSJ64543.1 hypothetical protein C7I84_05945 [Mesorhizobium ephedrae]